MPETPYPTVCPSCGADLTEMGAVTAVVEDYLDAKVTADGIETGNHDACGETVRAFCVNCTMYLFDHANPTSKEG